MPAMPIFIGMKIMITVAVCATALQYSSDALEGTVVDGPVHENRLPPQEQTTVPVTKEQLRHRHTRHEAPAAHQEHSSKKLHKRAIAGKVKNAVSTAVHSSKQSVDPARQRRAEAKRARKGLRRNSVQKKTVQKEHSQKDSAQHHSKHRERQAKNVTGARALKRTDNALEKQQSHVSESEHRTTKTLLADMIRSAKQAFHSTTSNTKQASDTSVQHAAENSSHGAENESEISQRSHKSHAASAEVTKGFGNQADQARKQDNKPKSNDDEGNNVSSVAGAQESPKENGGRISATNAIQKAKTTFRSAIRGFAEAVGSSRQRAQLNDSSSGNSSGGGVIGQEKTQLRAQPDEEKADIRNGSDVESPLRNGSGILRQAFRRAMHGAEQVVASGANITLPKSVSPRAIGERAISKAAELIKKVRPAASTAVQASEQDAGVTNTSSDHAVDRVGSELPAIVANASGVANNTGGEANAKAEIMNSTADKANAKLEAANGTAEQPAHGQSEATNRTLREAKAKSEATNGTGTGEQPAHVKSEATNTALDKAKAKLEATSASGEHPKAESDKPHRAGRVDAEADNTSTIGMKKREEEDSSKVKEAEVHSSKVKEDTIQGRGNEKEWLPDVRSLLDNSTTVAGALSQHISQLKKELQHLQKHDRSAMEKKKAAYEAILDEQHANTTGMQEQNARLRKAIKNLDKENAALREQGNTLREATNVLRLQLLAIQGNLSIAHDFIDLSMEGRDENNSKLEVLRRLAEEEAFAKEERAHKHALKKIAGNEKITLLQVDDGPNMAELLGTMDAKFDNIEHEQEASEAVLKESFEKAFAQEEKVQQELEEEYQSLTELKTHGLELQDRLRAAVHQLEDAQNYLHNRVESLRRFSTLLSRS